MLRKEETRSKMPEAVKGIKNIETFSGISREKRSQDYVLYMSRKRLEGPGTADERI